MRLSQQKSMLFNSSVSPKKTLKQPKQFVTKLNTDIQKLQNSIKHYNKMEKESANWKKEMNFKVYNCQLKALSQPKLQNILLESNFMNNMAIFGKHMNESVVKNSSIKLQNAKNKNYLMNSSGLGFRKTMSMKVDGSYNINRKMNNQNEMRKSQKSFGAYNGSKFEGQLIEQNPEVSFTDIRPQFNSFREEISRNVSNKRIDTNKNTNNKLLSKGKVSQLSNMSKTLLKCPSKNMHSDSTIFDQLLMKDNETIIDEESQSVMMQTSTRLFSQQFGNTKNKSFLNANNNISKELGLIPISQEKMITLSSQRNTKTIRQQIQQKTMRLQKQWLLTECYREKFNIVPSTTKEQSRVSQTSQNKPKRSINKLANIIQKVEQRRPSTSFGNQRTQNSRQTTLTEDYGRQKSKTMARPENNSESIHFNISALGFDVI